MPSTILDRPSVGGRRFPAVPPRNPLEIERSIRRRVGATLRLVAATAFMAFALLLAWFVVILWGWRPEPSSGNWDDMGFLAGLGGLAVTLFVATQIDSVTHWATSPDRVADRVMLEGATVATLIATAVEAWIVLYQGIMSKAMSLAPAVCLLWIVFVCSALATVTRPSPTASRRSLTKNASDQQRLNHLRAALGDPPRTLTKNAAFRRISLWGAVAGAAVGTVSSIVALLFVDDAPLTVLWFIPMLSLYAAVAAFALASQLGNWSVRRFTEGRWGRLANWLLVVCAALIALLSVLSVVEETSGWVGGVATALMVVLWCGPVLLHVLVVRPSDAFHAIRLAQTIFMLDLLQSSHQQLVDEQHRAAHRHAVPYETPHVDSAP